MSSFKDLSGQVFGSMTVLEKDIELSNQKGRVYWKCQCTCGRTKSVRADGLKKIQTCGECKKDLAGQRFGRLTAIEKGKKDAAQHQYWICKCDCGKIVEINSDNLRRGLTKSCGCLHSELTHQLVFQDITGHRFGKLVALEYEIKNQKAYWKCQCDCGNITIVAGSNLKNGHTQSCGCISYSIGEQNIATILQNNNISFIKEKIFSDLPDRRYDFYLPQYNRLIEFDGKQHFSFVATWHNSQEEFNTAQQRDLEKNQYALSHNIPLVRIPYTQRDNITLDILLGPDYLVKAEAAAPDMEEAQEVEVTE